MIRYLEKHNRSWMVIDPGRFDVIWSPIGTESSPYERAEVMKKLYPEVGKETPLDTPTLRRKVVDISCFVDSDHFGDKVIRRYHTVIIIDVNMAPIVWLLVLQKKNQTRRLRSVQNLSQCEQHLN